MAGLVLAVLNLGALLPESQLITEIDLMEKKVVRIADGLNWRRISGIEPSGSAARDIRVQVENLTSSGGTGGVTKLAVEGNT